MVIDNYKGVIMCGTNVPKLSDRDRDTLRCLMKTRGATKVKFSDVDFCGRPETRIEFSDANMGQSFSDRASNRSFVFGVIDGFVMGRIAASTDVLPD